MLPFINDTKRGKWLEDRLADLALLKNTNARKENKDLESFNRDLFSMSWLKSDFPEMEIEIVCNYDGEEYRKTYTADVLVFLDSEEAFVNAVVFDFAVYLGLEPQGPPFDPTTVAID